MDEVSPSMDGIFISQIFGENYMHHLSQIRIPFQLEKRHLWMSSMDGEMSSMDGEISSEDQSAISGCHPWMAPSNGDDG